jgi:hypothetical protein
MRFELSKEQQHSHKKRKCLYWFVFAATLPCAGWAN